MPKPVVFFCNACGERFEGDLDQTVACECGSPDIWAHSCEKCSDLAERLIEIRDQEPAPRAGTEYHTEARCARH